MTPAEAAATFAALLDGTASPDRQAALEFALLDAVQADGIEGVAAFLEALPEPRFGRVEHPRGDVARFEAAAGEGRRLVVDASADADLRFVDVRVEEAEVDEVSTGRADHDAFYRIWDSLLALPEDALAALSPDLRAVYLVASFEADVQNGGLGQYLSNREGEELQETLACLEGVGAARTAELLRAAAALADGAESFTAAWDDRPDDFERLDDAFHEAGEDLAGLVAHRYGLAGDAPDEGGAPRTD